MIKRLDSPPYEIDQKVLRQFDQRQTIFGRMLLDETAPFYQKGMYENVKEIIAQNRDGYSRIEFAQTLASWTIYDYFHGAFSWEKLDNAKSVMPKPVLEKHPVTDLSNMSKQIKETAKLFGASLVGISLFDKHWIYSYDLDGNPIEVPHEYKYAIVIAIAMDATNSFAVSIFFMRLT